MLYLASQSPRRRELLSLLDTPFRVLDVDVPEVRADGEPPGAYVRRVACDKAAAGLRQVASDPDAVVLAGDTEVVLDDEVFGKPADADDAARMLRTLSGRSHRVLSAVVLASGERTVQALSESTVTFDALDAADIARYVASGEPMGRAGAYAIQGRAQAFVARLDGSHSAVMGLPLREAARLLRDFGLRAGGADA